MSQPAKIVDLDQVGPGAKVFGFLEAARSRADFPVHLPLHIVRGAQPGPTLLAQAGFDGHQVEPTLALPPLITALDPSQLRGALIVAPMINTSGLEFERHTSAWDDQRLDQLGRGRPDGTVSEQLLDRYWQVVVSQADALLDIQTGELTSYHRCAWVYAADAAPVGHAASRQLALTLGLPHVIVNRPADRSLAFEAARSGKPVAVACIGGCPGFRDYRHADGERLRSAIRRALRHLDMIDVAEADPVEPPLTLAAHTYCYQSEGRGLVVITAERGSTLQPGDAIGHVLHPYTGERLTEWRADRAGVMAHYGVAWPAPPDGKPVAVLGSPV